MFTTEKQLVEVLKFSYPNICHWDTKKYNTQVLEEVDLGYGIADLVLTKIRSNYKDSPTCLTHLDVALYNIIETEKVITIDQIRKITRSSESSINKSLNKLLLESYIERKDSLLIFKKSYNAITTDSIAIEAKLKNWKRALEQAFRYKWFCEKSFVVLDSHFIKPALKEIDKFIDLNIGLIEANTNGDVKLLYKPRKESPVNIKMHILLNEKVKKHLS